MQVNFRRRISPDQSAWLTRHIQPDAITYDLAIGEKENHSCAIVFFDLCNFTNISATLKIEQVIEIIQRLFARVAYSVTQRNGMIDKYPGDGVVVFFPRDYSTSNDDYVGRAIDAIAEVMYWFYNWLRGAYVLPKPSHKLELAAGLDAGWISIAHVGSAAHSELILLGDRVNTASKCQQAAAGREVVVGEGARSQLDWLYQGHFSTGPSISVMSPVENTPYRSHRFDWATYAKHSWIDKTPTAL
jgi:adenylate cyclase